MLIGASGPSVRGLGVRGEERMQKMRVSLEDEVLLEADLGHYRHEHSVWSNMSIKVEGSDASPACTGMDSCAAESASFEHGAAAVLSVWLTLTLTLTLRLSLTLTLTLTLTRCSRRSARKACTRPAGWPTPPPRWRCCGCTAPSPSSTPCSTGCAAGATPSSPLTLTLTLSLTLSQPYPNQPYPRRDTKLADVAREAYTKHLEANHSWLLKNTFKMSLSSLPTRDELYSRLAPSTRRADEREQICLQEIREFSLAAGPVVQAIRSTFEELGLSDDKKA